MGHVKDGEGEGGSEKEREREREIDIYIYIHGIYIYIYMMYVCMSYVCMYVCLYVWHELLGSGKGVICRGFPGPVSDPKSSSLCYISCLYIGRSLGRSTASEASGVAAWKTSTDIEADNNHARSYSFAITLSLYTRTPHASVTQDLGALGVRGEGLLLLMCLRQPKRRNIQNNDTQE